MSEERYYNPSPPVDFSKLSGLELQQALWRMIGDHRRLMKDLEAECKELEEEFIKSQYRGYTK